MGQIQKKQRGEALQDKTSFKVFIRNKLLLLGLVFRLAITPLFAHQFDFTVLVKVARTFYVQGVATFFVDKPYITYFNFTAWPYPVLSYLFLLASYFPVRLLPWDIALFYENFTVAEKFFVKLPLNLCDLATAYILFLIAERNGMEKYAMPLALAYWLNPLSVYVSSFYGTFDPAGVMLALAAFYHFTRERYALAAIEAMLGAAVKFHALLLLPPLLVILWTKRREKLPVFLATLAVTYIAVFVFPKMIKQIPYLNSWIIQQSISGLIQALLPPRVGFNMSYHMLLARTEAAPLIYYVYTFHGSLVELGSSATIFAVLTFLILKRELVSLSSQTAYIVGTHMAFYLSSSQIHQHYALWALPFLLLFLACGKVQRNLVLIYNAVPIFHSFWRDSIFYFINQKYSPYGVGWGSFTATGTIFSIVCLVMLQATVKEQLLIYKVPLRVEGFFSRVSPEKRSLLLYLVLALTFVTIVGMLNVNGVYWASIPLVPLRPIEWGWDYFGILPRDRELMLLYLAVTLMVPLPLALTLPRNEAARQLNLVKEAKLLVPFILMMLTILIIAILNSTLTYIGLLKLIDHMYYIEVLTAWQTLVPLLFLVYANLPMGGFLTLAHGGIMTSVLIWVAAIITLLTIIPLNQKEEQK